MRERDPITDPLFTIPGWVWGAIGVAIAVIALLLAFPAPAGARDRTLPDDDVTPGKVRALSHKTICETKWGRDQRSVTAAMKRQVFANYNLKGNADASQGCRKQKNGRRYEVDHRVPRCAGGADAVSNLWPQCYSGRWNATLKDRLEVRVCKDICSGDLTPEEAHEIFLGDWHEGYRRYFGNPK